MGQDNGSSALQYAGDIRDSDRDIIMCADHGGMGERRQCHHDECRNPPSIPTFAIKPYL